MRYVRGVVVDEMNSDRGSRFDRKPFYIVIQLSDGFDRQRLSRKQVIVKKELSSKTYIRRTESSEW